MSTESIGHLVGAESLWLKQRLGVPLGKAQIPSLGLLGRGFGNACAWAQLEWHLRSRQFLGAGKQDAVCWVWWRGRGHDLGPQ